mmetsp:Transcript_43143/g.71734  ORF Transcript_43143/g.71734 Transcript_43143/m.71734 type:complete len:202 (-) Transcript_43143:492-1097(-)
MAPGLGTRRTTPSTSSKLHSVTSSTFPTKANGPSVLSSKRTVSSHCSPTFFANHWCPRPTRALQLTSPAFLSSAQVSSTSATLLFRSQDPSSSGGCSPSTSSRPVSNSFSEYISAPAASGSSLLGADSVATPAAFGSLLLGADSVAPPTPSGSLLLGTDSVAPRKRSDLVLLLLERSPKGSPQTMDFLNISNGRGGPAGTG